MANSKIFVVSTEDQEIECYINTDGELVLKDRLRKYPPLFIPKEDIESFMEYINLSLWLTAG
jgi:hypothetical protein